jgi:hypothetical protein
MLQKKDIPIIKGLIESDRRSHSGIIQPFMNKGEDNSRSLMRMEVACDRKGHDRSSIIGVGYETVAGE